MQEPTLTHQIWSPQQKIVHEWRESVCGHLSGLNGACRWGHTLNCVGVFFKKENQNKQNGGAKKQ